LISPEEVNLAYQLMLGREPESQDMVNNICQTTQSVSQLREVFLNSAEFRDRMGQILDKPQQVRFRHPFHSPYIPVESSVTDDQLCQMFERINRQWEHLGQTDPYWSVVTQPHYHLDQFDQHRNQFFTSGNYICDVFLSAARRNNINPTNIKTCLEVGAGVGRVTNFLAKAFQKVIAADISEQHLNLARQYLAAENIQNVEFQHWQNVHALDNLSNIDAIFSVITLQHNPPPVIAWMLGKLLFALNPGGVAFLQIPTYRNGYLFEVDRYLHFEAPKTLEMHFLPQYQIFRIVDESDCICLEIREDGLVGNEDKILSNTFLIQKHAKT
jgi:2-polyprenyl-3-methyl-5-hydroxy-6-metoxy-1,4-benzoquinol methylase